MEQMTSPQVYTLSERTTDYTISSFLGLSIGIVTTIFVIIVIGIQIAGIRVFEWLSGDIELHGDPSILYLGVFFVCATMLVIIQNHFANEEDNL